MAQAAQSLAELNTQCTELLSNVELVCELGLDANDELFASCHRVLNQFLAAAPSNYLRLSEVCPAAFVVVLTVIAGELGTGGELWDPIMEQSEEGLCLKGLVSTTTPRFGLAYRESLKRLGLAEFAHVEGRVNLSPILIHAGIPANSSEQVWRKVSQFVSVGVVSGREIVQDLRNNKTQLQYFKVPAKRFINEAGEFAVDFFERMANSVLTHLEDPQVSFEAIAARHGLPEKLTQALFGLEIDRTTALTTIPSAQIYLDIDTGMGPYCVLPPIRDRQRQYTWSVCGNNFSASSYDEKVVQLDPSNTWTWEIMSAGERLRTRHLTSVENRGLWLFDDSAKGPKHVPELGHSLDEGIYFLLAPQNVRVAITRGDLTADAQPSSELRLGYSWSQFTVLELNLFSASELSIFADDDVTEPLLHVNVVRAPSRPTLEGPTVQGISGAAGERVFTSPPMVVFRHVNIDPSRFTLGLRTPSGRRVEKRLTKADLRDEIFDLAEIFDWEIGSYRIEIIGPMGTGISESFIVLFQARLELEDRLFMPTEVVTSRLVYRKQLGGSETSIEAEFESRRDRLLVQVETLIRVELRIPRLAFAIGGPGKPPNFGNPAVGLLALDDIKQVKDQQLHVRTGTPTDVTLLAKDASGHVFHQRSSVSSGSRASTTFEINDVVDSIEQLGIELTALLAVVGPSEVKLPLLTIQQRLEYRITEHRYAVDTVLPTGCLEVEVRVPELGPSPNIYLTSLERVWDSPRIAQLEQRASSDALRVARFEGVPPGRYSLELSIGLSQRPLRSSLRKVELGTPAERRRYRDSLTSDPATVAELTVLGVEVNTPLNRNERKLVLERVASFVVSQQRDFSFDSAELATSAKFIAREGNVRGFAEWFTQIDAEAVSLRELENSVLRLLPIFIDSAGVELDDSGSIPDESSMSSILISRLWNRSPLLGVAFTSRLPHSEVDEHVSEFGKGESEPNFEELAELSFPALRQRITQTQNQDRLFSDGYVLKNFHDVWKKCWTGRGPDASRLDQLDQWSAEGRRLYEHLMDGQETVLPRLISATLPAKLHHGRKRQTYSIGRFVHHLYRTAWLIVRPSTPLDIALEASQLLAGSYGFAKGLTDRAIGIATFSQFPRMDRP